MINGPTSGRFAVALNLILQLFNAGSSSVGNANSPTADFGDTTASAPAVAGAAD